MEERRLQGLCFNCDEPFVRVHQCKKVFRIDLIEGDEEEGPTDQETQTNQPEISLNAIRYYLNIEHAATWEIGRSVHMGFSGLGQDP